MNFFRQFFSAVANAVRSVVSVIESVVRAVVNALVSVVQFVVKAISSVISWFTDIFGNALNVVLAIIIVIVVMYFCAPCAQFLIQVATTVWNAAVYVYEVVASAVAYAWTGFLQPAWQFATTAAATTWDWISGVISAVWSEASYFVISAWDAVKEVGATVGDAIGYASKLVGENPVLATALGAAALGIDWKWIAIGAGVLFVVTQGGTGASRS